MVGHLEDDLLRLEEIHRFPNGPVQVLDSLHWDVLRLYGEIIDGLALYRREHGEALDGVGLDTWGVDFALLDAAGNLLGNPHHYRDSRTDGMMELVFGRMSREQIFERTGIQFMQVNTLYQVFSMAHSGDPQLKMADTLLMMPDLFHYWLTGRKSTEFTIASTSQMFDIREKRWALALLDQLGRCPARCCLLLLQGGGICARSQEGLSP